MACFTVPAAEAIITTIAGKIIKNKEIKDGEHPKVLFSTKIGWLNKMLWGGSALLAFEHVWHGEVVPFFPFLTAVENGEAAEMLHEMATAGVSMALLVTAVWGIMVGVTTLIEKRGDKKPDAANAVAGGLA
ncbi:MAG: hypothetical protein IK102_06250 [Treponema sp.]|nr:hypothetical protein [Treponema sp.]